MIEQAIQAIENMFAPLGILGEVGEIIGAVTAGIAIPLFATLCGFLIALIVVRIILKVI